MALIFSTALEQYGHWKSENSTGTIRAFAGPVTGEPSVGIATGSSSSFGSGRCPNFDSLASAMAAASVFPFLIDSTRVADSPRLKAQLGSLTRHSAIFMPHPQL